jgi:hypothetical protein
LLRRELTMKWWALLLWGAVLPVTAQIHVPMYTGTPLLITGGVLNKEVLQSAQRLKPAAAASPATTVAMTAPSTAARELAQNYPAAERPKAEQLFKELLLRYREVENRFGVPRHDLAGALAAFIAGSHMAYRNAPFPDEHFKPLVAQMRGLLQANPAIARAPMAERQQAYEQLAILGMFMAGAQIAQQRQPDAVQLERLQAAGAQYLQRLLAVEPARLVIGPAGLSLRGP